MIMDATQVGLFADCLVDLWTFNFELGREMHSRYLSNGISQFKLLAMPYGTYY
jgi:hypothetical protein